MGCASVEGFDMVAVLVVASVIVFVLLGAWWRSGGEAGPRPYDAGARESLAKLPPNRGQ
jgi:hypothetical protein